jgi:hypothetical protein
MNELEKARETVIREAQYWAGCGNGRCDWDCAKKLRDAVEELKRLSAASQ